LVVQHAEPEGPYAIGDALDAAGVDVDVRRTFAGAGLPADAARLDGLVVMGGPMSAYSDLGFPTRMAELNLLSDALERGVPILGVCLGSQLLALAGGGRVYRGPAGPEIGWGLVELTDHAAADPLLFGLPRRLPVLHWHGDTFELPLGAVHLAASSRYRAQGFRCGAQAWGFQFHLEVDEPAIQAFVNAFGTEAAQVGENPRSITAQSPAKLETLAPFRAQVVTRFAELIANRDRERLAELP